jgi:hypothetical protein
MPNTPCTIGEGMTIVSRGPLATDAHVRTAVRLFQTVGRCIELEEKSMDVVTALNSSGPAFAYLILEALAEGGVMMGLRRDVAMEIAAQMLQGSARMVLQTGLHPAALKDQVTTPGRVHHRRAAHARGRPDPLGPRQGGRGGDEGRLTSGTVVETRTFAEISGDLPGVLRVRVRLGRPLPGRPGRCQDLLPWDCSTANSLAFLKKIRPASVKRLASLRMEDVVGLEAKRARARIKALRTRYPSAGRGSSAST